MDVQISHIEVGHIRPRWLQEKAIEEIIVPPEARILEPITVLHLHGSLDGVGYEVLVEAAQVEIENGALRLIIDLTGVDEISTAGLIGLYEVGARLDGESLDDLEGYAMMGRMRAAVAEERMFGALSLAAPTSRVLEALSKTGFDVLAPCLPTVDDAISESPVVPVDDF